MEIVDDKWIDINERMPEKRGWYLVFHIEGTQELTSRVYFQTTIEPNWSDYWWSITHWQPLPNAPKK